MYYEWEQLTRNQRGWENKKDWRFLVFLHFPHIREMKFKTKGRTVKSIYREKIKFLYVSIPVDVVCNKGYV
jgi:hypothetical protein